jgi:hypothetical protein
MAEHQRKIIQMADGSIYQSAPFCSNNSSRHDRPPNLHTLTVRPTIKVSEMDTRVRTH